MANKLVKELLLSNTGYWVLNKRLVQAVGVEPALFLTTLAEAEKLTESEGEWFYQTIQTIEKMTTLTRYKQDNCIKELEKLGIINVEIKGVPAKRYFRLNYSKLLQLLDDVQFVRNSQTSMQETNKLDCKKLATSKELSNKELNKEIIDSTNPESNTEDIKTIIQEWNRLALSQVVSISKDSQRYKRLMARIKENGFPAVLQAIDNIKYSRFLQGSNAKGWTITFDWLVRPNNFIKVLEGNYTDLDRPLVINADTATETVDTEEKEYTF